MRRVNITCLHTEHFRNQVPSRERGKSSKTHATISVTSLVVGFIDVLKKFTTTALNLSFSAGYLLNACYKSKGEGHSAVRREVIFIGLTIFVNSCPRIRISSSYTS